MVAKVDLAGIASHKDPIVVEFLISELSNENKPGPEKVEEPMTGTSHHPWRKQTKYWNRSRIRAVPEIILGGGGTFFFSDPSTPRTHMESVPPPTPRTRKCFN